MEAHARTHASTHAHTHARTHAHPTPHTLRPSTNHLLSRIRWPKADTPMARRSSVVRRINTRPSTSCLAKLSACSPWERVCVCACVRASERETTPHTTHMPLHTPHQTTSNTTHHAPTTHEFATHKPVADVIDLPGKRIAQFARWCSVEAPDAAGKPPADPCSFLEFLDPFPACSWKF